MTSVKTNVFHILMELYIDEFNSTEILTCQINVNFQSDFVIFFWSLLNER
jgi:hypothetical protein